jgi:3-isopropylmalate/(R)-2-methylmalate dehydratase large subunit
MGRTLYDKIWDEHVVHTEEDGTAILYIDRHLVHEVTSPQAFEGLREAGRKVWRMSSIVATADHNTPTTGWERATTASPTPISKRAGHHAGRQHPEFGAAAFFPFLHKRQGIVHVIGPEHGATLPGMTVVCGDSHTSTHGAFGALAHGIGTSEVEHVLATQTLLAKKAKNMLVQVDGTLPRRHGQGHRAGHHRQDRHRRRHRLHHRIRRLGHPRACRMEGRMTVCNMAIEAGARAGLVAVDDKTIDYVKGRPLSPTGVARSGTRPWPTGRRCTPTPARTSTPWSSSTPPRSCRRSPGAPRPRWCWASTPACPTPTRRRTPTSAAPSSAR